MSLKIFDLAIPAAGTSHYDFDMNTKPKAYLAIQAAFTYGSGGTTAKFWIQTSFDDGLNWHDVMCFAFATASGVVVQVNQESVLEIQNLAKSDGALADNTVVGGLFGNKWRIKLTVAGTYVASSAKLHAHWQDA